MNNDNLQLYVRDALQFHKISTNLSSTIEWVNFQINSAWYRQIRESPTKRTWLKLLLSSCLLIIPKWKIRFIEQICIYCHPNLLGNGELQLYLRNLVQILSQLWPSQEWRLLLQPCWQCLFSHRCNFSCSSWRLIQGPSPRLNELLSWWAQQPPFILCVTPKPETVNLQLGVQHPYSWRILGDYWYLCNLLGNLNQFAWQDISERHLNNRQVLQDLLLILWTADGTRPDPWLNRLPYIKLTQLSIDFLILMLHSSHSVIHSWGIGYSR